MGPDRQTRQDLDLLLRETVGAGTVLDELTLLRTALRLYCQGQDPGEAIAQAAHMLSDSLTKQSTST
jgi:hypothetical protein